MAFSVVVGVSKGGCWISSIGKPSNSSLSQYSKLVGFGESEGIGSESGCNGLLFAVVVEVVSGGWLILVGA